MVTTLNINNLSDINGAFISDILKAMYSSFGEIEITIKPKTKVANAEILQRIEEVENGADLLSFTEKEFDELNKKLLAGIKPDKSQIRKSKKHETNNIISE